MLAKIAIGGEIDVVGSKELADGLDGLGTSLTPKPRPKSNFYALPGSIVTVGTGTNTNVINFGSPPSGRCWDILGITTAGLDDFTVVAGNVALYTGNRSTLSLGDLRVPKVIIPQYEDFGPRRLYCVGNQELYATVNGVAAGTVVNIVVTVSEWREKDIFNSVTR